MSWPTRGLTVQQLAQEVQRQQEAKRDFLAPARNLALAHGRELRLASAPENTGALTFTPNSICHGQIASRLGIPQRYYDRLRQEAPHLLDQNVNHWFENSEDVYMVRTLDDTARGFLSDRYRPLDHADLLGAVLPAMLEANAQPVSCQITDSRLYLKVICQQIQAEVTQGDVVYAGACISNSEVGLGQVKAEAAIMRPGCYNIMVVPHIGLRKTHVGRRGANGFVEFEQTEEFFADETRRADDKAFWLKVRDIVKAVIDQARFEGIVNRLRDASTKRITGNPVAVVQEVEKRMNLSQLESGSVLNHLISGGDLSAWGMANAITRTAQDVDSYDRSTELERMGSAVIELPRESWELIANRN